MNKTTINIMLPYGSYVDPKEQVVGSCSAVTLPSMRKLMCIDCSEGSVKVQVGQEKTFGQEMVWHFKLYVAVSSLPSLDS